MKKVSYLIITVIVLLFISTTCFAFDIVTSPQKVLVNGERQKFEIYNIDGSNYFKLRDIAYILKDTSAKFSVEYNHEKQMIDIKSNSNYTVVGGEMELGNDKSSTAVVSRQSITIDGKEASLQAYNIGGNNFFKLRDVGEKLNFNVGYDGQYNLVLIDTGDKLYGDELNFIELKTENTRGTYTTNDGNVEFLEINVNGYKLVVPKKLEEVGYDMKIENNVMTITSKDNQYKATLFQLSDNYIQPTDEEIDAFYETEEIKRLDEMYDNDEISFEEYLEKEDEFYIEYLKRIGYTIRNSPNNIMTNKQWNDILNKYASNIGEWRSNSSTDSFIYKYYSNGDLEIATIEKDPTASPYFFRNSNSACIYFIQEYDTSNETIKQYSINLRYY